MNETSEIKAGKHWLRCKWILIIVTVALVPNLQSVFHRHSYFTFLHFFTFYWAGFYSCPEGKGTRGLQGPIQRCPTSPNPPFAYERQPQHPTLFSNSAWVLLRPTELSTFKDLWDGTSDLSSLSEKTRKSYHLQMKLQRQHFLLSYLKTDRKSVV